MFLLYHSLSININNQLPNRNSINISKFTDKFTIIKKRENTMSSLISSITNAVSISNFNRGLAGKIFEEVKKTGPKSL